MFNNRQSQLLDMFGYLSFSSGNCPLKALDTKATHVAVNKVNRDSQTGNSQQATRSGEMQVYKTENTNVPKRSWGTKRNRGDNRAGYFTSSLHRYRDGRRAGLMQTCGEVTRGCGRWCRDGKRGSNGVSTISGDRTGTFLYSYRAEGGKVRVDGCVTGKLETHISREGNGSVQNRTINCDNGSCTRDVQGSTAWACTEGLQRTWGDSRTRNVQNSKGDRCTAILQDRRKDRCTTNNGGESRTIGVHCREADSRATRVQNNSTDSCTGPAEIKTTGSYICTVIERCTSNVQYNEGCNTVIKHISARKCTIRGQNNNEENSKNFSRLINHSRSNNTNNDSTVNCTSVIETNRAANCANNITSNLKNDCVSSANKDNAENSPINKHKPGTTNGTTTVMYVERMDKSKSCKLNHDDKSKLGDKEAVMPEHTRKPALSSQVTICKRSIHTSGVEDGIRRSTHTSGVQEGTTSSTHTSGVQEGTRSISSPRRGIASSAMCSYTTKKGLITPPSLPCPQEKSPCDSLAINERSKLRVAQSIQPMNVARVNYTESATTSSCSPCPQQQSPSAPLAINESSNFKSLQMILPMQAACVGNTDQSLEPTADIETHSSSENCSTDMLLGFHERAVSECKPQVCSQNRNSEKRRYCQYYNTLANRHIGNLIEPLNNIAIAEMPNINRRTKLNRDIWPTETKNRTWSNGVRDGNGKQVFSKFRTAHERSHQTTNKAMSSKHSTNSCSQSHSATSGVTQQQRSTRSEKSYLFKRKDILDKSSKYTIPSKNNFRKVPGIRQQNPSAASPETTGQTSSCPVIQINSEPADSSSLGLVPFMSDPDSPGTNSDTPGTDADNPGTDAVNFPNFPTIKSGGFLSVPGPQVYFEFERSPNQSDQ